MIQSADNGSWVRHFHEAEDALAQLVCFPHAGGSASYFFPVSAALSPEFDVHVVQYPGRQDRRHEPFVATVEAMADRVYAALTPVIDRPVALFGHSMGAQVAFEVAYRLEQSAGVEPIAVFVSAARAPSRFRAGSGQLGDDRAVVEQMRMLGGTDARVFDDAELLEMALPPFRNDFLASEQYRRGADIHVDAPLVVMTADDDPHTTADEATAWCDHTSGGTAFHTFHGGHFFLEAHAGEVIALIAETLRRSVSDPPPR